MARVVRLTIDSNEQTPLPFPPQIVWSRGGKRELVHLEIETKRMRIGDYCLSRHPRLGIVERKKNLDELAHNLLTKDSRRFHKAWTRFTTGCQFPILLVEQDLCSNILRHAPDWIVAEDVRSALYRLQLLVPRLTVIWSGGLRGTKTRLQLGAEVARLLLTCTEVK